MKNLNNSLKMGVSHPIFAFRDADIGLTEIFTAQNEAIAVRHFAELINKDGTLFNKYYKKAELWKLGEYNDVTGAITNTTTKVVIKGEQCYIPKKETK